MQTFDFTNRVELNAGYTDKVKKYKDAFKNPPVIPIVVTPWLDIHPESVKSMKKYLNISQLFKMLAFQISNQNV
jgi:hypothetical protein